MGLCDEWVSMDGVGMGLCDGWVSMDGVEMGLCDDMSDDGTV